MQQLDNFKRLSKGITHVIYKDGQERIKQKALEYNCKIVPVTWVVKCEELEQKVDEADFPLSDKPIHLKPKKFKNLMDEESIRTPPKKRVSIFRQKSSRNNKKKQLMATYMRVPTQGPHLFSTQNSSVLHQNLLSSRPKTPQFNTKNPSVQHTGGFWC